MTVAESMAQRAPLIGNVTCLLPYVRRDASGRRFAYQLELYARPKQRQGGLEHAPHLRKDEFFDIDHSMQAMKLAARMS